MLRFGYYSHHRTRLALLLSVPTWAALARVGVSLAEVNPWYPLRSQILRAPASASSSEGPLRRAPDPYRQDQSQRVPRRAPRMNLSIRVAWGSKKHTADIAVLDTFLETLN